MMEEHLIFGVHLTSRAKQAVDVQRYLTEYGCNIKTRIGLHEVNREYCSPSGVILLEMYGERELCQELFDKLESIEGVDVQQMRFTHDE